MASKLKNIRLTSVDLVRAGANPEADICLFKSFSAEENGKGSMIFRDNNRYDVIQEICKLKRE